MSDNFFLPAEWYPQSAIMMAWPHENTDWAYILEEVQQCFKNIAKVIVQHKEMLIVLAPDIEKVKFQLQDLDFQYLRFQEINTNDTWARDTCAITTIENGVSIINDFKFNGWGLKFAANFDNLLTSKLYYDKALFSGKYKNHLNFVLEGGSIESDGNGIILTTSECLLSKNRNGQSSKDEIESYLKQAFGAKKILWLDHGFLAGDDTDSHIDTLARLAPDNTILYVCTDDTADIHYEALQAMKQQLQSFRTLDGKAFNLIELPLPDAVFDEDGMRIPATYANFLIGNSFVAVPVYNQPDNDQRALDLIQQAFPDYDVVGVDCNALIKQHGSLHCVTMQFPINTINQQFL